jgi:hypothetical protein
MYRPKGRARRAVLVFTPTPKDQNCAILVRQVSLDFMTKCIVKCIVMISGTFIATPGASLCSPCGAGQSISQLRSTSCEWCKVGRYIDTQGASSCIKCEAGKYRGEAPASSCIKCALGMYSSYPGWVHCKLCPIGKMGNTEKGKLGIICNGCEKGKSTKRPSTEHRSGVCYRSHN